MQSQKWQWPLSVCKANHSISVIQVYAPTTNAEDAEVEWFYEDLKDLIELPPKNKRCSFHHRGLECKSRKSRDTWNNRQVCPWSTKWGRAKANRVFPREHTGHTKHSLPTTQKMNLYMDITTRSIPCGIDYILCSWRWRSSIWSAKTRPGADYGSDQELLIAKFRLKLKKVRETTRPFRYDLNQIPYDYTWKGIYMEVEVTNRFKGLGLIDSAWRTMDRGLWHCTGGSDQNYPKKKKCNKAKWLSEEGLQIS